MVPVAFFFLIPVLCELYLERTVDEGTKKLGEGKKEKPVLRASEFGRLHHHHHRHYHVLLFLFIFRLRWETDSLVLFCGNLHFLFWCKHSRVVVTRCYLPTYLRSHVG